MKTYYFKIQYGYDVGDYLSVTQEELPKALALFIHSEGRGVFESGALRGKEIIRIVPDWHADQNWNSGWKMTPDDYATIAPFKKKYQNVYETAKKCVDILISENRMGELSTPFSKLLMELKPVLLESKALSNEISKDVVNKFTLIT